MEGILFDTEALVFPEDAYLLAEADLSESNIAWPKGLSAIHSFGGKRRLAHFSETEAGEVWSCPDSILQALDGACYIRMVLATPAYFTKGWLPGWLDSDLRGKPEAMGEEDIVLELKWACVPRWQPISGWSYGKREEKAIRRMVPAGSVYFFKVERGTRGCSRKSCGCNPYPTATGERPCLTETTGLDWLYGACGMKKRTAEMNEIRRWNLDDCWQQDVLDSLSVPGPYRDRSGCRRDRYADDERKNN